MATTLSVTVPRGQLQILAVLAPSSRHLPKNSHSRWPWKILWNV